MEKIEISKDEILVPGDRIEMIFSIYGPTWLRAAQLYAIEERLRDNKNYELLSYETTDDNKLIMNIRIKQPDPNDVQVIKAGVSPAIIVAAIAAVGVSLFYWLSLDGTYKLVETPAVKTLSVGILVFAVAYLVLAWKGRK